MRAFITLLLACLVFPLSGQVNTADYIRDKGHGKNSWAIIVANEDYQSASTVYVENEELAIMQAEKFRQFLVKQIGLLPEHILFYPDAVNTHIKLAIAKLQKILPAKSSLIFYYRGKTYNDNSDLYLVPVDVSDNETFYMLGLKDLCKRLASLDASRLTVIIDSKPGTRSGTSSVVDKGFSDYPSPSAAGRNTSVITLNQSAPSQQFITASGGGRKPEILIDEPLQRSLTVNTSTYLIKGKVKSDCSVNVIAVNGQEAHYNSDGSFLARVNLNEGENNIAIEAINCAGRTKEELLFICQPGERDKDVSNDSALFAETNSLIELGKNYAVIIGESKYRDPMMPDLFYPLSDARKVRDVLTTGYTFNNENVLFLENPTKKTILDKLDSVNNALGSKDNLLIFYAGHGSWDEKTNTGYWLPSDAQAKAPDTWLMNSLITGFVSRCKARHTLVVADACFGGSIFRTRAFKPEEEKLLSEMYLKMSKKAMTSGDLTEVPDESLFVKNFLLTLTENTADNLSSEKVFFNIKPKIVNTIDLIPQFGIIKNSGDEGGDFIFFRKKSLK